MSRLHTKLRSAPALTVSRVSIGSARLAYVLVANRTLSYRYGKSRIAYIGTTRNGFSRVAQSAAERAEHILANHGVTSVDARIVTCTPRQRVRTWHKLERALLILFREQFGEVPLCNSHGRKMKWTDELEYFSRSRLEAILKTLG